MIFGLFGKKKKGPKGPEYDKKLIEKFKNDHRKLVKHIQNVQEGIKTGNHAKTLKALNALRLGILGHFMEEDLKLYWYLKKYYDHNPEMLSLIESFESSIKTIQKEVMTFLDRYNTEEMVATEAFAKEFAVIVEHLSSRIESEESNLYTLYRP